MAAEHDAHELATYIESYQDHCEKHLPAIAAPANKRVLVVGSGWGTEMLWCLRQGAAHVVGLDPSQRDDRALRVAVERSDRPISGTFVMHRAGIEEFETDEEPFDLVLSNNVFEHLPDLEAGFAACRRLVRYRVGAIAIFAAPLFHSSEGHHCSSLLGPWEHLLLGDDKLMERLTGYDRGLYESLNRMTVPRFLEAVAHADLAVEKFSVLPDRNLRLLPKLLPRLKARCGVSSVDLSAEGVSCLLRVV